MNFNKNLKNAETNYVSPRMTEFGLLSEQTFLTASAGVTMSFGSTNQAGAETTTSIWNDGQDF